MNAGPVRIFRRCAACRADFSIVAMSSRAMYCPACRRVMKQTGMVVNLNRGFV